MQNSLCVQVLRSPILAALLHGTRAVGVSQTLRRGTRNGITEILVSTVSVGQLHCVLLHLNSSVFLPPAIISIPKQLITSRPPLFAPNLTSVILCAKTRQSRT